jgi:cadmium resistance protein CadD (predicted permease)
VGYTPEQVELVPLPGISYGIGEELSVADWEIVGWDTEVLPFKPTPGAPELASMSFSFTAERLSGYFIVKIIIPLVLIVMMSWVVFWISPKEAGTQISVSVTSMLTLIAYRFAVGTYLPKVSYLTRLDGFILMSTILVFMSLVEVVVTSTLARGDGLAVARRVDRWARTVFPFVFILLSLYALVI